MKKKAKAIKIDKPTKDNSEKVKSNKPDIPKDTVKKRIKELEDSNKKLLAIINNQFQFTGMLDTKGRVLFGNETAIKMAGLKKEELLGEYFWETPWWSHSEIEQKKIKTAIRKAVRGEFVRFDTTHPDSILGILWLLSCWLL